MFRTARAGFFFSFIFLILSGNLALAQARLDSEVRDQLSGGEMIRVIVEFEIGRGLQADMGAPETAERRQAVRAIADAILNDYLPGERVRSDRGLRRYELQAMFAVTMTPDEIQSLAKDRRVSAISIDRVNRPMLDKSTKFIGYDQLYSKGVFGYGSLVAVVDTGVDLTHPFYKNYLRDGACFSTTIKSQGVESLCPKGAKVDFSPQAASDCPLSIKGCGHGTHVAGIAAGAKPDGSLYGTGPYSGLIPVKVFSKASKKDCGKDATGPCALAYDSDVIAALEWLYLNRGTTDLFPLAAINLSLGGGKFKDYCDDAPIRKVIQLLEKADVATVIAAGNEGYADAVASPACVREAVTVGAVCNDSDDIHLCATYTNMGKQVDLLAPGSDISSSVVGGGYGNKSGTSMAAPHVTGLIAALNSKEANSCVNLPTVLSVLQTSGKLVTDKRPVGSYKKRRVDAVAALDLIKKATGRTIDVYGDGWIEFNETSKKGVFTTKHSSNYYEYLVNTTCPKPVGWDLTALPKYLLVRNASKTGFRIHIKSAEALKLPKGLTTGGFWVKNTGVTDVLSNGAYHFEVRINRRFAP